MLQRGAGRRQTQHVEGLPGWFIGPLEIGPGDQQPGKGHKPWRLLTNEPDASVDDALRVVLAYARRWRVEMRYRTCKTDLAV